MPEVKPLLRYPDPRYPEAYFVQQNPELLRRLPARFAAKPAVCAALGAILSLGLAGCGVASDPATYPAPEGATPTPAATPGAASPRVALSIPIFEYGTGMGSYGCVSVAPPVFLSEEEAAEVIREEAAKYGLDFSGAMSLQKATVPLHDTFEGTDKTTKADLDLDGYDAKTGIGFEFVSREDLIAWQDPKQNVASSVENYYFKDAAQAITDGNQNIAAFYDPMSADFREFNYEWPEEDDGGKGYEEYAAKYDTEQREKSLEDLRAQVRDFLEWLKGQGII